MATIIPIGAKWLAPAKDWHSPDTSYVFHCTMKMCWFWGKLKLQTELMSATLGVFFSPLHRRYRCYTDRAIPYLPRFHYKNGCPRKSTMFHIFIFKVFQSRGKLCDSLNQAGNRLIWHGFMKIPIFSIIYHLWKQSNKWGIRNGYMEIWNSSERSTWYLESEGGKWVRYWVEHMKGNSISKSNHVLFCF